MYVYAAPLVVCSSSECWYLAFAGKCARFLTWYAGDRVACLEYVCGRGAEGDKLSARAGALEASLVRVSVVVCVGTVQPPDSKGSWPIPASQAAVRAVPFAALRPYALTPYKCTFKMAVVSAGAGAGAGIDAGIDAVPKLAEGHI